MMRDAKHPGIRLFLYTLLPSPLEIGWSLVGGFIMVALEFGKYTLLQTSINTISQSFIGSFYKRDIVGTLDRVAGNNIVVRIMFEMLWCMIGLLIYEGVTFFIKRFTDWEGAEHEVRFSSTGAVIKYPLVRSLAEHWLWRFTIIVATFAFSFLAVPYIFRHLLSGVDFYMSSVASIALQVVTIVTIWMCIFHIYIVLLRLYMMRVRLSGNIIY